MTWHILSIRQALVCGLAAALFGALFGTNVGSVQIAHASGGGGGNTWTINDTDDSGTTTCAANAGYGGPTCQLRDALNKAQNGDTIQYTSGPTVAVTYPTSTLTVKTNVHLVGPPTGTLVINGINFLTSLFTINSGVTASFTGLTFREGGSTSVNGGAINDAGSLAVTNCDFDTNTGQNGGAIAVMGSAAGGTAVVSDSTFTANFASGSGGGIYVYGFGGGGSLTINASTFSSNNVESTGGAVSNTGTTTISASTFSGNSAVNSGGAIYTSETLTDSGSTYSGNSSTNNGGAISNDGTASFNDDTLSGNKITSGGGNGGAIDSSSHLVIGNSTIANNTTALGSGGYGGGIHVSGPVTTTVYNSTISGNSADSGGGIYSATSGSLSLGSTIVAKNTDSGGGPDIYTTFTPITSLGSNLIGNIGSASITISGTSDQIGHPNSLIDPLLLPLNAYGTLLPQTMALQLSSPAIGKGNCNLSSPALPVSGDERGTVARKFYCDVGAYESAAPALDTIGIFRASTHSFYLRLHNSTGVADSTVAFNHATKPYPIVGDWTGAGVSDVGVYDQNNGLFVLCKGDDNNFCAQSGNLIQLVLGNPNDMPLSGRWYNGSAIAGVGVFRPSNGLIYLKNALTTGFADATMVLGIPGDVGLAGDWSHNGYDSPGVFRPSNSSFFLSNQVCNCSVFADDTVTYGVSGDAPVVGDWIGQSSFGIGLFRPTNGYTYLKNVLSNGFADNSFYYGAAGDVPVAGHWQAVYPPQPSSEAVAQQPPSILNPPTVVPSNPATNPNAGLGD